MKMRKKKIEGEKGGRTDQNNYEWARGRGTEERERQSPVVVLLPLSVYWMVLSYFVLFFVGIFLITLAFLFSILLILYLHPILRLILDLQHI